MKQPKNHTLYRFYDNAGTLLYVGITWDPPKRFRHHEALKEWFTELSFIRMEQFDSRELVKSAERMAIQLEKPKYNIMQAEGNFGLTDRKALNEYHTNHQFDDIFGNKFNCMDCGMNIFGHQAPGWLGVSLDAAKPATPKSLLAPKHQWLCYHESCRRSEDYEGSHARLRIHLNMYLARQFYDMVAKAPEIFLHSNWEAVQAQMISEVGYPHSPDRCKNFIAPFECGCNYDHNQDSPEAIA